MTLPAYPAADVIVAGHICLDVIPDMGTASLAALGVPGALVNVGGALLSTGGTVANSGLALHRLGANVRLMGKIGDDPFGRLIAEHLERQGDGLSSGLIVGSGESERSSYSIVISPRGSDRIFLHCPGTNDTFAADDVTEQSLAGAKLFHFGYPPLMKAMYEDGGRELEKLLAKVKAQGLTVSLDMSRPDPDSPAGRVDWRSVLKRVLPYVDLYLPSWEETHYMLGGREGFDPEKAPEGKLLADYSAELLDMGAALVGLKLGEEGLYIRTTASRDRLEAMGACAPRAGAWLHRELLAPCFETEVVGTTGAGDCTIAGFLCGLLHGLTIEQTLTAAVGVGACSVESLDATGGIVPWPDTLRRIEAGWSRRTLTLRLNGWSRLDGGDGTWMGPYDKPESVSL
ncbi:carbohydrate kinase family protein [Paenibacillus ginsengarvi]|uniref:Carbohydrate kinase family protein n=2 Tax=Paenibacillus ginsengarvi TaxID=400777 RepID=A0A3B0CDI2_9BACL|nr:carbohydrate kinase family protein [Paenibacillus ginsengarvi]